MGIRSGLLIAIITVLLSGYSYIEYVYYRTIKQNSIDDLFDNAEKLRAMAMATRRVYHKQFLESGLPLTPDTVGFLPAHAMNRISKDLANWDSSGFSINNVSDRPRNPNQAADKNELVAIERFRNNRNQNVYFEPYVNSSGETYYLYARPIWIEKYCLKCHGKKEDAPETIRAMYNTAYDYKVGDLRGILSIKMPASIISARTWEHFSSALRVHVIAIMSLLIIVIIFVRIYIHTPLKTLVAAMTEFTGGDYDRRIGALPGNLGALGDAFNDMADKIALSQEKLQKSEEKFRQITSAIPGVVFQYEAPLGGAGRFTFISSNVRDIWGMDPEEWKADPDKYFKSVHPDDREAVARETEKSALHKTGLNIEYRITRPDGQIRWIQNTASVNRAENGDITWNGVMLDISERKRTQKASLRLSKARDYFSAITSHELSTPLTHIQLVITLLENIAGTSAEKKDMQMAKNVLKEAYGKIDNILSATSFMSKLQLKDRESIRGQSYSLRAIVLSCVDVSRTMIHDKNRVVTLDVDLSAIGGDIFYECDHDLIQRALNEVLSNAIKYSEDGKTINLTGWIDGEVAILEIADQGIGISAEELDAVTNPYFSVEDEDLHHTSQYKFMGGGMGLGLTIAKLIVEHHNGRMEISSPGEGQGVKVTIYLPLSYSC